MLKHAGELAFELFQNTLFNPPPSRVLKRRLQAVVPVRENRLAQIQELSFGARPFIMCGLPIRRIPAGPAPTRGGMEGFFEIVGHPEYGIPFGPDRLVLLWLATEAVRTGSRFVQFESAAQILTDWALSTGGKYYRRRARSFRRVFGVQFSSGPGLTGGDPRSGTATAFISLIMSGSGFNTIPAPMAEGGRIWSRWRVHSGKSSGITRSRSMPPWCARSQISRAVSICIHG